MEKSLVDVVDMIEDNVSYFKQQNPPRVKIFAGDTISPDNEGSHTLKFIATIMSGGIEYRVSFPISIDIYPEDDLWAADVEAHDTEDVEIDDENDIPFPGTRAEVMEQMGVTFDMIDGWASDYCLK